MRSVWDAVAVVGRCNRVVVVRAGADWVEKIVRYTGYRGAVEVMTVLFVSLVLYCCSTSERKLHTALKYRIRK